MATTYVHAIGEQVNVKESCQVQRVGFPAWGVLLLVHVAMGVVRTVNMDSGRKAEIGYQWQALYL